MSIFHKWFSFTPCLFPLLPTCNAAARPNQFGMPGIVPPYVPSQILNIPQTSLQAKPVVSVALRPSTWEKPTVLLELESRWERYM